MINPLPPAEDRPLTAAEQTKIVDRVNELLELTYRAKDLPPADDTLDALVHTQLTRNTTSAQAAKASRSLLAHWKTWDQVRQTPTSDIAAHLKQFRLNSPRAHQLHLLLTQVHADTIQRGWHSTTLRWLTSTPEVETENYLSSLPNISTAEAHRIAAATHHQSSLADDRRAVRILKRLSLNLDLPGLPESGSTPASTDTASLPRGVDPELLRQNLVHHSRATCHRKAPDCGHCQLISFCPTGRTRHTGTGQPVAVEAFAGGGGLGEGLTQAGFDVAIAVELDRDAAQTYRYNHPGTVVVEADATTITADQLRYLAPRAHNAAALAAGPPCQGYSAAGPRRANDSRNQLYKAVVELATQLKPRFVVIENVPGMRQVAGESYVNAVIDDLDTGGYHAHEALLRACDYGVPQLRRRMIFLAQAKTHGDAPPKHPDPTHCPGTKCQHPEHTVLDCPLPSTPTVLDTLKKDELLRIPSGYVFEFHARGGGKSPLTNASTMAHSQAVIDKIAGIAPGAGPISYRRLHDDLARTIVAGHRALPVHPKLNRTISVREAARIQGFEDTHVFAGPRSKQPLQVANAVPPSLGCAIGKQLRSMITAPAGTDHHE